MAKSHYENVPLKIKQEIGNDATIHVTKAIIESNKRFSTKGTTIDTWEKRSKESNFLSLPKEKGRPNLVDDEMLQNIRYFIIESLLVRTVISWQMVIAIGTCVINVNEPKFLK